MSYFKAKMHQIRFRLGLRPRPRWAAYSAPPDTLAGFKGATSKGKGGKARRWEGMEGEEKGEGGWVRERDRREGEEGKGGEVKTGGEGRKGEGIVHYFIFNAN